MRDHSTSNDRASLFALRRGGQGQALPLQSSGTFDDDSKTELEADVFNLASYVVKFSRINGVEIKMSTVAEKRTETFEIAGHTFTSRLIIGTGKYRSFDEMKAAHKASGAEMVTVAVRRVPLDRSTESFLDHLDPSLAILPNTAGCYTAEDAVRTARLAREALNTDLIKLEVIGDPITLFPDNEQTLEAARVLVREGFTVLPYFTDDLIMAKKLLDAGCAAVMPLAAPIGSGLGVQNPANLSIMREQLPRATIIVDAGVGTASDAAIAMELGADAVLMNTAIAEAQDSARMATAMRLAIEAGRHAYLAGRMPKRLYASASSPLQGVIR
ncbi:MAG: thiazole synthase [Acidobacteriota bacterium]|nr:thiazole synthase [Acidobacteriota bacterium]